MAGSGTRTRGSKRLTGGAVGANQIRLAPRPGGGTWGLRANNGIRRYRPATADGQMSRIDRQIDRTMSDMVKEAKKVRDVVQRRKPELDRLSRQLERMNAQAIAARLSANTGKRIVASAELGAMGGRLGARAIQRRMQRAAAAAARGSQPAARAQGIYANQLAYMGTGKAKASKNNLQPGPSNTNGKPKRRRKR
jgi:hypothetical protein